jgi:hypothetical protein
MFYWVRFECKFCAEAGGFQGWCLCRKSVVGDPTVKIGKDDFKYMDGEIQMWPVFNRNWVMDPWHYAKYYWIFDIRIIREIIK